MGHNMKLFTETELQKYSVHTHTRRNTLKSRSQPYKVHAATLKPSQKLDIFMVTCSFTAHSFLNFSETIT